MFPRKKKNRTGTISVVVIDKSHGYKEVKNFGVVKTEAEADALYDKAVQWIRTAHGQSEIDFAGSTVMQAERLEVERVLNNISSVTLDGPRQILGQVYDSIGFNCIKDEVLRHLVITRICQPSSKVATVEYLKFHHNGLTREHNIACFYHTIDKIGLTA